MRRTAATLYLGSTFLLVGLLAIQVFLAGLGVFSSATAFATHRDTGYTIELVVLVVLVLGIVGRAGRAQAGLAALALVLMVFQSVFVGLRGPAPEIAALHPLNGFLIFFIAIVLARRAWVAWSAARRAPTEAATPDPSPSTTTA